MSDDSVFRHLLRASTLGIHLAVSIFVGFAIGHYLDRFLGTNPWLTFLFLGLGIFAGFRDMFRIVKRDVLDPDAESQTDDSVSGSGYDEDEEEEGGQDDGLL